MNNRITTEPGTLQYAKLSDTEWHVQLPFLAHPYAACDIEELLHAKRSVPGFRLTVKLLSRPPRSLDEYLAHEQSVLAVFGCIAERRYPISFVASGANRYGIFENDHYPWGSFLDSAIIASESEYYSCRPIYRGNDVRFLSFVFDDRQFKAVEDDVISAYLEHETYSRRSVSGADIPVHSVRVPVGSIIQVVLGTEP